MKIVDLFRVMFIVFLLVVFAPLVGCSTYTLDPNDFPPEPIPQEPPAVMVFPSNAPIVAVVVALAQVDPQANNGWYGECSDCTVDGDVIKLWCDESDIPTIYLKNQQATRSNVFAAVRLAWRQLSDDGLLFFYESSHGGQLADNNGDEEDGQDETLCLYDGQVRDDDLAGLWQQIRTPRQRVWYVTDCCEAGTNFKRPRQVNVVDAPRNFAGALIHYGGAGDGEYSYSTGQGGQMTIAMIDTSSASNTFRSWPASIQARMNRMPNQQRMVYAEFGNVTDAFRSAPIPLKAK